MVTEVVVLPPGALRDRCDRCGSWFIVSAERYHGDPIEWPCFCGETVFVFLPR